MFRRSLAFVIFFLLTCFLFAQENEQTETFVPALTVKFSPLHLINFYPTIQLAVERKIKGKLSGQVDLGYIVRSQPDNSAFSNMRGYKAKAEARQYIIEGRDRNRVLYGALELYRNAVDFDRREWR